MNRLKKGQSSNPNSLSKESHAFREWCREIMDREGTEALLTLARTATEERTRMLAWRVIAEYAFGRSFKVTWWEDLLAGDDGPGHA